MNSIGTISISSIRALKSGDTIRDNVLKGFGARYRNKYITYFVHTRISGRLAWIKIGHHGSPWTPDQARKRAAELLHDIARGIDPRTMINDPDNRLSFAEIFEKFITAKEGHVAPITVLNYRLLAQKHIAPYFKNRPLNSLSRADIISFHQSMRHIPAMANHALVLLNGVFNWASVEGHRKNLPNPCLKIKKYKANSRAQFLKSDDLARLAEACRWALASGTATPIQIAAILVIMFTGARRSEIFSLERNFVDRNRMIARIPKSKTGAKIIPLNPHAIAVLDSLPEVQDNPYYFVGRVPGEHITEIRRPWNKIRERAKLPTFRIHDFRHSFASFAGDNGATAQAVGSVLGHASIETTKIYMHLFNNRAQQTSESAANTIFDAFNPLLLPSNSASEQEATH